jgi:hypothetical protein
MKKRRRVHIDLIWGVDAEGNLLAPPEPVTEHA